MGLVFTIHPQNDVFSERKNIAQLNKKNEQLQNPLKVALGMILLHWKCSASLPRELVNVNNKVALCFELSFQNVTNITVLCFE